jgi:hypothetical protein
MTARQRDALIVIALLFITAAAYGHVLHCGFVDFDDPEYMRDNVFVQQGFSLESFKWAFSTTLMGSWNPLVWLSFMLDRTLWGSGPLGPHLTNLALHSINVVLLFGLLRRMTTQPWPSALAAALLAVHPWIPARKDVLSTMFWLLTMGAYVQWLHRPGMGRYLLIVLAYALGLMSKPMLVTLPLVLVLVDIWPLQRWPGESENSQLQRQSLVSIVLEKLPLMVMGRWGSCR